DVPGTGSALPRAGAGDAPLPALARRDSVRGGLLGQALHPVGGGSSGAVRPGPAGGGADRRGALLLPLGREADVHRPARATDAGARQLGAYLGAPGDRAGGGAARALSRAARRRRDAGGRPAVLTAA